MRKGGAPSPLCSASWALPPLGRTTPNCLDKGLPVRTWHLRGLYAMNADAFSTDIELLVSLVEDHQHDR